MAVLVALVAAVEGQLQEETAGLVQEPLQLEQELECMVKDGEVADTGFQKPLGSVAVSVVFGDMKLVTAGGHGLLMQEESKYTKNQ